LSDPLDAPLIELKDVRFGYGERTVLDGLNLTVPRGQILAVMGGSGNGKTSLLGLLGGRNVAWSGSVRVDGQEVGRLDGPKLYALRRRMGMLFQFGALFTDLSVFDNVAFPYREQTNLPEAVIRDLVLMKLEAVGLRGAADSSPSQLSGGMARRVALARAVAHDPMLAMYDEPFAGLDPISLNVIADGIRRLNDALGTTSIVVTYDVSESLKLVDYVYVIADGVLAGEGKPDEVLASEDPFLKQFLHALPEGPIEFHFPAKPIEQEIGV